MPAGPSLPEFSPGNHRGTVSIRRGFDTWGALAGCVCRPRAGSDASGSGPPKTLVVAGDVAKPITLTPADLKALPRTRVEVKEKAKTIVYEGVLVGELLKRAGAPAGSDMRGNAVASYVLASANDGYQVVFSLAELDPGFTSNDVIVADSIDGRPLFDYQGPFRIVARRICAAHDQFACSSASSWWSSQIGR